MQLTHPLHHPAPIGFILLFAMFLLVCYLTTMAGSGYEHF
jgi:hypothetical protein